MIANIEILILCGGEGRRLRSVISNLPKPMAPIQNKPFMAYLVDYFERQGFVNFCFLTGYMEEKVRDYFVDHCNHLQIRFSNEEIPLGTGGAIQKAISSSEFDHFFVVNGDTFFQIDLKDMLEKYQTGSFLIALNKVNDVSRYGQVEIDSQTQRIVRFIEKKQSSSSQSSLINAGIYCFDKESIQSVSIPEDSFCSLEREVFDELKEKQKLFGQSFSEEFIDIGIPEDYERSKQLIPALTKEKV